MKILTEYLFLLLKHFGLRQFCWPQYGSAKPGGSGLAHNPYSVYPPIQRSQNQSTMLTTATKIISPSYILHFLNT